MKSKHIKKSNLFFKAVILIFAVFSIISLIGLQGDIKAKRDYLAELTPQIEELRTNIDELNNLLTNGSREDIIERAAREKLGYVYADEQIYTDLSPR